jgi:cytidine deaminase
LSDDITKIISLASSVSLLLKEFAKPRRHHIACGFALADDLTIVAINIVSNLGPASVCAEQIALGKYLISPGADIDVVITLRATFQRDRPFEIVAPCGRCRELLYEYAANSRVAIPRKDPSDIANLELYPIKKLMPHPFVRRVYS